MPMSKPKIRIALLLSLSPTAAFAYFDPGTGSLLIQAAIGGMAAVVVFWGQVKAYTRALFTRGKAALPDDKSAEESDAK
jgi:hypothetical protein